MLLGFFFASQGTFGTVGRHFWLSHLGRRGVLEGKDAAKAPTMHKTALHSKTYPVQNVCSAKNEKLWFRNTATGAGDYQSHQRPFRPSLAIAGFGLQKRDGGIGSAGSCVVQGLLRKIMPGISLLLYLCSSYPPYLQVCALATSPHANPTQPCELLWGHDLQEVIPGFSCSESSLQRK